MKKALLTRRDLAEMLGVSVSTIHNLNSSGHIPMMTEFGGLRKNLWNRKEMQDWVEAGMPHRRDWNWSAEQ